MILPRQLLRRYKLPKIIVLLLLLVLVGWVAIPSYLTGKWPWTNPPPVTNLQQLKTLRQEGLKFSQLSGWNVVHVEKNVQIGGRKWLVQEIQNQQTVAILLLLPQKGPKDQPQVEWLDIRGFHRWQTDSDRPLKFTVESMPTSGKPPATVEALFFRSRRAKQTFAVLQWYALPNGGSTATSRWFWEDSIARVSNRRISWVAVCIILPIQPADDIELYRPLVKGIGEIVQAKLMAEIFQF
jgi:cyanoexosortase B-associated protein